MRNQRCVCICTRLCETVMGQRGITAAGHQRFQLVRPRARATAQLQLNSFWVYITRAARERDNTILVNII